MTLRLFDRHLDDLVRQAIEGRRVVEFHFHGRRRVGEPYVYGVHGGKPQLLIFQTGGDSGSGPLPDWRRANLHEVSGFELTDETFAIREIPSGRHSGWDEIYLALR